MIMKTQAIEELPEKGQCLECSRYTDCPRMKGMNHCENMKIPEIIRQKLVGMLAGEQSFAPDENPPS